MSPRGHCDQFCHIIKVLCIHEEFSQRDGETTGSHQTENLLNFKGNVEKKLR